MVLKDFENLKFDSSEFTGLNSNFGDSISTISKTGYLTEKNQKNSKNFRKISKKIQKKISPNSKNFKIKFSHIIYQK